MKVNQEVVKELKEYIEELEMIHESLVFYKLNNASIFTEDEEKNMDNVLIIRKINIRRLKEIVGDRE